MTSFEEWESELLKDPEMRRLFYLHDPSVQFTRAMVRQRIQWQDLAKRAKVSRRKLLRFLTLATRNVSLDFLFKLADALDCRLVVTLEENDE
uniref:Putative DNA binding, helix-turn-helix domain containing protein n=1 Tax=viral metagenome TaxID=1070528 RepID=A0A6M3K3I2_9ZZZZ